MCRPQRLECKNPRRNAAVYHAKRLGFIRDWTVTHEPVQQAYALFGFPSIVTLPFSSNSRAKLPFNEKTAGVLARSGRNPSGSISVAVE